MTKQRIIDNPLKNWTEDKKEQKDYELLEEVEKKIKNKKFAKYEPELQNAFKKVREQLKKKTKERKKKFDENLLKEKHQKDKIN